MDADLSEIGGGLSGRRLSQTEKSVRGLLHWVGPPGFAKRGGGKERGSVSIELYL